jgi:sulfur carrier protein|uniref:Thiamine biosynthesis protein S n=1 Tax=Asterionella formosa TaxID=210441 RepID=A0A023H9R6_9STRA|nr:thiamine biosynthesis protein S [Asterionella formosa]AGH28216.1 thiamine biosynthesis protein S [Asterionella formosa]WGN98926.1 thiamine biosynthesis protein S [Asterionella formosa]
MIILKRFFVNGLKYETYDNFTIYQLLSYFNYNQTLFVLEYNNLIYEQKHWTKLTIKNNDKIEIVTIVGGG